MSRRINAKKKTGWDSHLTDSSVLTPAEAAPLSPSFPAGHDISRIAIHATPSEQIQAKMEVSQPGDASEQVAEQVAEQVMQSSPSLSSQATPVTSSSPAATSDDDGQPLDEATRAFMEPRFGHDFSRVRIHTDEQAAESARSLNALAYTERQHVVFDEGQYVPETHAGKRLLAHELTHTIQQERSQPLPSPVQRPGTLDFHIQRVPLQNRLYRQVAQTPDAQNAQPSGPQNQQANTKVPTPGAGVIEFEGVQLSPDTTFTRFQLEQYLVGHGEMGTGEFVERFRKHVSEQHSNLSDMSGVTAESTALQESIKQNEAVLQVLDSQWTDLRKQNDTFVKNFVQQAQANALKVLENNEAEVKKEAIRYGITEEQITEMKTIYHWQTDSESTYSTTRTVYHMDSQSASGKGLQAAANMLLTRRQEVAKLKTDQEQHKKPMHVDRYVIYVPDEEYHKIGEQIDEKEKAYDLLRQGLISQFPVLASFSEDKSNTSQLEQVAQSGPSPETAALIGQQIAEKLGNIQKVRDGFAHNEVDIWKLPRVVGLTRAQLGVTDNTVNAKLIDTKVQEAQPGALEGILLMAFNLLALILAPLTEGLSLVVAAGVNAAVAAGHVEEYLMKEALRGSAFDVAKALSADEPSLFWLAVEIAGVFADIGMAAAEMLKLFKALAPLAKAAAAAKEGETAIETLDAVKNAAKEAGGVKGAQLAETLGGKIEALRQGEGSAVRALGATEEEAKALETALKAGETELASSKALAEVTDAAVGEIKISKAGKLYSCGSPCTQLREKFAASLARNPDLEKDLIALEERALQASKATAEAETLAKQVAQDAVKLQIKLRTRNVERVLKELTETYPILQKNSLDADAISRIVAKSNEQHIKGQVLEELMNKEIGAISDAEKAALAGGKVTGEVEFIPGYQITDLNGRQLTDGVLAVREGNKLRVVTVFESKAGKSAAKGLSYSYKSLAEMSAEELKDARSEAIELLREKRPELENISTELIEKNYKSEVDKMMKNLPKSEAGQVRLDIERLDEALIGGQKMEVISGPKTTKFVDVLPSDVTPGKAAMETFKKEGLNVETKNIDITSKDLQKLASDIAKAALE